MAVQVDPRSVPRLPPPDEARGAIGWLRHNLFRTRRDSLLTVVVVAVVAWAGWQLALLGAGPAPAGVSSPRTCACSSSASTRRGGVARVAVPDLPCRSSRG